MTQPDSASLFFEVLEMVKTEFEIKDAYLDHGVPTFIIIPPSDIKEKIERLYSKLKLRNLGITIRQNETETKLLVSPILYTSQEPKKFFGIDYSILLFIATIVTVTISGYLTVLGYIEILKILNKRPADEFSFLWIQTALYTISVMSIIGLHELGHTIACRMNHVEASLPLFIPGIPGLTIGTFGAIIRQKELARNRDQLFDIGFAGPLVGFVVSMIVSYFGYSLSLPVSLADYQLVASKISSVDFLYPPLLFLFLEPYLLPRSFSYFLHPLALAGWVGTLITFLNVLPIGQLDGGHVARAVFGPRWHRILAYISIFVMFLTGWWSMAFVVIFFMKFEHPGTLDDVSPLSQGRKVLTLLLIFMMISCFTFSSDSIVAALLFRA